MLRISLNSAVVTHHFYERGDIAISSKNTVIARNREREARGGTRQSRGNREIFYVAPGLLRFARNDGKKDGLQEKIWDGEGMALRLIPLLHEGQ